MKISWLGTTAVALLLGTGAVIAQSQNDQKREESPRAQQTPSKDADRPGDSTPGERAKGRTGQPESKGATKEPQRGEAPADRKQQQSQDEQRKQSEQKQQQSQDEQRKQSEQKKQQSQDEQRKQSEQKQQQSQDEQRKQSEQKKQQSQEQQKKQQNQAQENKQPSDTRQQQGQQKTAPAATQSTQGTQPSDASQKQGQTTGQTEPSARTGSSTSTSTSTSTSVNQQQRREIVDQLRRDRSATSQQNINIQVNVGERVPDRVRLRALPPDIVRIAPEYRSYEYTVIEDRVYIIEPRTRKVVDVISESGPSVTMSTRGERGDHITITTEQRDTLRQAARRMTTAPTSASPSSGSVPSGSLSDTSCLTLRPVPEDLVRANPEFGSYRMLAIGDQVVLIDPRQQKIVDVVE